MEHGHRPYGGQWEGPLFILTHHPEDAEPADGVTFLDCDVAEAVRIGLVAGGSLLRLQNLVGEDPNAVTNLRFRPSYDD